MMSFGETCTVSESVPFGFVTCTVTFEPLGERPEISGTSKTS
jgi:hypothetical protein